MLDGEHHTDELGTKFEAGWPMLQKWLLAIGGGSEDGGCYGLPVNEMDSSLFSHPRMNDSRASDNGELGYLLIRIPLEEIVQENHVSC